MVRGLEEEKAIDVVVGGDAYIEMLRKDLRCPNCLRIIPNDKFLTEGKCIWCDAEYHLSKSRKDKKERSNKEILRC